MMAQLALEGVYNVGEKAASVLKEDFHAEFCNEAGTAATIKATFGEYGYLCDTHTAVGLYAARQYQNDAGDKTKILVASTASPYKFPASILRAITGEESDLDEFAQAEKLAALTKTSPPESITGLKAKPVRFNEWRERENLKDYVVEQLGVNA
jgi:threonine synthase